MTDLQDIVLAGLRAVQTSEGGNISNMINNIINQSCINTSGSWQPCMDMLDTQKYINIFIDVPGIEKESINVKFFNNKISVSGVRKIPYKENKNYIVSEVIYGKFERDITIPISVTNKINTHITYENGVLHIKIDKEKELENMFTFSFNDDNTNDT